MSVSIEVDLKEVLDQADISEVLEHLDQDEVLSKIDWDQVDTLQLAEQMGRDGFDRIADAAEFCEKLLAAAVEKAAQPA